MHGSRATASYHVLPEILQMLIVVGDDGQQSLAIAGLAGHSVGALPGEQTGDPLLIAGDDDLFARLKSFNQLRQAGLGFFEVYGGHGTTPPPPLPSVLPPTHG